MLPVYDFTTDLATLAPPPEQLLQVLAASPGNCQAMDSLPASSRVSPVEFFDPAHVASILSQARRPS